MKAIYELAWYYRALMAFGFAVAVESVARSLRSSLVDATLRSVNGPNEVGEMAWVKAVLPYSWLIVGAIILWLFVPELRLLVKRLGAEIVGDDPETKSPTASKSSASETNKKQ